MKPVVCPYRKVWRYGLEVARKVKGSQGHRRWQWPKPKPPYTAVSPEQEVHANHCEVLKAQFAGGVALIVADKTPMPKLSTA